MREGRGDLRERIGRGIVVVTASGSVTPRGEAVLGRGFARQAAEAVPGLAAELGRRILSGGNRVHDLGSGIVSFPVEETAWSVPDLRVIERSARELSGLADATGWAEVAMPRPGCGGGGLSWEDVGPVLARILDDRFLVLSPEP